MNRSIYFVLFFGFSWYFVFQDTEGCQTYTNILYSRGMPKKVDANSTGVVRNESTHEAGDGSGGEKEIKNAKELDEEIMKRNATLTPANRNKRAVEDLNNLLGSINEDMPSMNIMSGLKIDHIGASRQILRIEIPTEDFEFLLEMIGHFSYPIGSPNGILLVNKVEEKEKEETKIAMDWTKIKSRMITQSKK